MYLHTSRDIRDPRIIHPIPSSSERLSLSAVEMSPRTIVVSLHSPDWRGPAHGTAVEHAARPVRLGMTNISVGWEPPAPPATRRCRRTSGG